eukprot:CAMPEP_0184649654 /NCGR_PEP_ID=MMETSP0308-20130426/7056_1 /TAXON_ID=38269 /ORGANISM="Gloeochaete witrockiana, Strain SAG 46.84" /LENGTH=82 /DNA_ID=CAMNT_0027082547 /DNA_START=312 /DNA_END=560 /DNA_ORIENTATION=-
MGAAFGSTEYLAAKARGEHDLIAGMIGACAGGSVLGLQAGKVSVALGGCAASAALLAFSDIAGGITPQPQRQQLPSAESSSE